MHYARQACHKCSYDGSECMTGNSTRLSGVPGVHYVLYVAADPDWLACRAGHEVSAGHCQQHPRTER